jgi:hypothetical protein
MSHSADEIENQLFEQLESSYRRYVNGESSLVEYSEALKRFSDFVVRGIVPEDLKPPGKPPCSEKPLRDTGEKKA